MLAASVWLNKLYHIKVADIGNSEKNEQVDLNIPLTYADRFRIRKPGTNWEGGVFFFNPPHVDGVCHTFACQSLVSHSGYSQEERSRDGKTRPLGNVSRIY